MCKLGVICQERLKIEVKLLLNANRKSYMRCRLAQQRMTLSDFEWQLYALCAISAVAELLVYKVLLPSLSPLSCVVDCTGCSLHFECMLYFLSYRNKFKCI